MTEKEIKFSTTLNHWSLPKDTEVEICFESDSDWILFVTTRMSTTKLGSSVGLKLSDPLIEEIKEKALSWNFKGVEHITPTPNNSRDFYWIKFTVHFHYLDLIKILEKIEEK